MISKMIYSNPFPGQRESLALASHLFPGRLPSSWPRGVKIAVAPRRGKSVDGCGALVSEFGFCWLVLFGFVCFLIVGLTHCICLTPGCGPFGWGWNIQSETCQVIQMGGSTNHTWSNRSQTGIKQDHRQMASWSPTPSGGSVVPQWKAVDLWICGLGSGESYMRMRENFADVVELVSKKAAHGLKHGL